MLRERALEEAAAHHVVELALERIKAADNAGDFVVEMILISVCNA